MLRRKKNGLSVAPFHFISFQMASAPKRVIGLALPRKAPAPVIKPQALVRPSIFDGGADGGAQGGTDQDVNGAIRRAQEIRAAQAAAAAEAAAGSVEDSAAYDYDSWKETADAAAARDRDVRKAALASGAPKEARYITSLLAKAAERKRERDTIFDRMQAKELAAEDAVAGTSEKFITPAYQAVLAERAAAEAEEARRAAAEVHAGSTGSMNDFYLNLMTRNVSFGAPAVGARTPAPEASAAPQGVTGTKRGREEALSIPAPVRVEASGPANGLPAREPTPPRAVEQVLHSSTGTHAASDTRPQRAALPLQVSRAEPPSTQPPRVSLSQDAVAAARAAALARLEARKGAAQSIGISSSKS